MRKAKSIPASAFEAKVSRRVARLRIVAIGLLGASLIVAIVNAATLSAAGGSLVQRWWSLIPILIFAALLALMAARNLWLLPRELTVRRWLEHSRPLHEPLRLARRAEERIRQRLEDHPRRHELAPTWSQALEGSTRLAESISDGPDRQALERLASRIDAYQIALNTVLIDSLLKRDWLGSEAFETALERAAEQLEAAAAAPGDSSVGVSPKAPRFQSVAVLPFADLSPLGDQEHFSQGLAEELIMNLTKIRGLRVIARGLAFSLAEQDLSLREIGRRLGVETVLDGSVQRTGERLSVSSQLICVSTGEELWTGVFDEGLDDVFKIEGELVRGVVDAIGVEPTVDERRELEKSPTRVVGAFDFYLRGRRYFAQYHGRGMEFALEMFTRAIELDGQYALAHAGIADCCAFLYANSGRSPAHRDRALAASARALEIDPELAEAHVSRGVALSQGERPEEAAQFFETALRLNPKLFEAHYFYARHHFTAGQPEKAIVFYESAAELRPEDYQVPLLSAQVYDDLGRPEDGIAVRRRGVMVAEEHLKLNPDDARALYMGANGLVCLGEIEKGLEWARRARNLQPNEPMALYNLACVYSLAGEIEEAVDCLAACIESGFSYRDWAEHDSNLDAIRDDPRFGELMRRLD